MINQPINQAQVRVIRKIRKIQEIPINLIKGLPRVAPFEPAVCGEKTASSATINDNATMRIKGLPRVAPYTTNRVTTGQGVASRGNAGGVHGVTAETRATHIATTPVAAEQGILEFLGSGEGALPKTSMSVHPEILDHNSAGLWRHTRMA